MVFDCFGGKNKVIIAMAHIGPLPGTPLYDAGAGILRLIDDVLRDVERVQAGGVDAITFGNENNRPYVLEAPLEGGRRHDRGRGSRQACPEASFRRQLLVGSQSERRLRRDRRCKLRLRNPYRSVRIRHGPLAARLRRCSAPAAGIGTFGHEIPVQHQRWVRPFSARATDRVAGQERGDAILVSGPITGQLAAQSDLRKAREAISSVPVFANTRVSIDNVTEVLSLDDGVIIGTHFKIDGNTWNAMDVRSAIPPKLGSPRLPTTSRC
jgi:uncharacterized protein